MLFWKIVIASELMNLIYMAVEILGGFALAVLVVSFIAHKIKKSKGPKVYEMKVDKENELKMILKDEKKNKEIVKGALSKSNQGKKSGTSKTAGKSGSSATHSKHKPSRDKEIKSPHRSRKSTPTKHKHKSSTQTEKSIRVPRQKKKLPGRDTRIQILNKLSNTQPEIKPEKEKKEGTLNKFYDVQDSED